MNHLEIRAALPEQYGVYLICRGKRQYLSNDKPVTLELAPDDSVTLAQDGPMTRLEKALAAAGIFLTAPLQLAYQACSRESWNRVIPFRVQAVFQASGNAACHIAVVKGASQLLPPRLVLSGPNVSLTECRYDASPWVFRESLFIYLCRIVSGEFWILGLLGYLWAAAVDTQNVLAACASGGACFLMLLTGIFLSLHTGKICRQKIEALAQAATQHG